MYRQGKQSIQVTIRIRPLCDREITEDSKLCVISESTEQLLNQRLVLSNGTDLKSFAFDQIIGEKEQQEVIFERVGRVSMMKCLEGYNCSIFAYGQTGAGKTFTMMGVGHDHPMAYQKRGLIPRTLQYLFESVDKQILEQKTEYLIQCRFLQIYNEAIIDLLDKNNKNLQLREDLKKGVYVDGLSEAIVTNTEQALQLLRKGSKGRHVGSTFYNDTSSRSHSVFTLSIQSKSTKNSVTNLKQRCFHFIDLAGSQRTKLLQDQRLKQGCSINKSLHVLGMVINSLVQSTQGKPKHVGYRDSKLTFLLKDSLGGNSKTHLIANISPSINSYNQTLSTLSFAKRVKLIKVDKALINQDTTGSLETLKLQIVRLRQQLLQLKSNTVASHLVSMQSIDGDTSQLTQLAFKNENQVQLQRLFKQYVDDAIEKQTKMQVQVLRCSQRLRIIQDSVKDQNPSIVNQQNQCILAQSLKYNISFLTKLSHLLSSTISDRQNITHILQSHPNNTFIVPHSQSPQKSKQQQYHLQKIQQLNLQTQLLNQTIKQNQLLIQEYQQNQMKYCNQISEIILQNAKALEEIKDKCGGQLLEMEKYEEQMENSINKMTLELLELKETLLQKQDEMILLKSNNNNLNQQLAQYVLRLEREGEIELEYKTKVNQLKTVLFSKEQQLQSARKELEQAISIVNNVENQFEQEKKNNSQRYKQILRNNQQKIWDLERQVSKYEVERASFEKQKQLNIKRNQQSYSNIMTRQTLIAQLRDELQSYKQKLQLQINIKTQYQSTSKSQHQQSMQSRYQSLLSQKNQQILTLQQSNESLKLQNNNISNDNKLKSNVQTILNSRLQSQMLRNRQIQQQLYCLKQQVLQSEQKEIRQNRQLQSLKRKQNVILDQLNNTLKEKTGLEEANKMLELSCLSLEQEVQEIKQKMERKQLQFNRFKVSSSREIETLREQFEEYRKRSHQHQIYMKQLFEQNTHSKQKIINDTKKHIALLDNQISNERETVKEKLEEIKELNEKITGLSSSIKQKQQTCNSKQQQIIQLKEQIQSIQLKFDKKMQQRENSFNEYRQRKHEQIQVLQAQLSRLVQLMKQQDSNKVTMLQQQYSIMKHNHQQLLNDYQLDINQKQKQIKEKNQQINQLKSQLQLLKQTHLTIQQPINRSQQNSQITFRQSETDTNYKLAQLQQQYINSKELIQTLTNKLIHAENIVTEMDNQNHQLISKINTLNTEVQALSYESETLMREKELISSDLNQKIQELERANSRWDKRRKEQLNGIEEQFKEYKEETQKINDKLIKNYEVLRQEQEKYKQLVERYEEVIQWNQRLVQQNNSLREREEQDSVSFSNIQSKKDIKLDTQQQLQIIEQQNSAYVNRTQDITGQDESDIVNMTQQSRQQQVQRQYSSLQQAYEQLQHQYVQSSRQWQEQKQSLAHTISNLKQQLYNPHKSTDSYRPLKKARHSVQYQQQISLKLQLQRRGCELHQLINGISQICYLLNLKGLSQGNTRYKIQTIKSNIQNMQQLITGYKKNLRQKQKQIDARNINSEIKERQFNRIKMKMIEGKSLRGVEEMRSQNSILQELHKRIKGQENRNINSRMI